MDKGAEQILRGVPISEGVAIGHPFFFAVMDELTHVSSALEVDFSAEEEMHKYRRAWRQCCDEIFQLQIPLNEEKTREAREILEAQLYIARDTFSPDEFEQDIREGKKPASAALRERLKGMKKKFDTLSDPFFRGCFQDFADVGRRILSHLSQNTRLSLAMVPKTSVVFADDLTVTDTTEASHIQAFVTKSWGLHSHAAIIAKAKGIPCVGNIDPQSLSVKPDATVIIDGRDGTIILNPLPKTLEKYQSLKKSIASQWKIWEGDRYESCQTREGIPIEVTANMEMASEQDLFLEFRQCDIGLFRTEFLLFFYQSVPSEEEQFNIYRSLIEKAGNHFLVIRTYDLTHEKVPETLRKSIGECEKLRRQELFFQQIRAILRASLYGNIRILFPKIATLEELRNAKEIVERARATLIEEGYRFSSPLPFGCMIELPSAAVVAKRLALECDFLSIGTNDLLHAAFGVGRDSAGLSPFRDSLFLPLLSFVRLIVEETRSLGKPLNICGDIVVDLRCIPLLIGLGLKSFSLPFRYIPLAKRVIRGTTIGEAERLLALANTMADGVMISRLLTKHFKQNFPLEAQTLGIEETLYEESSMKK